MKVLSVSEKDFDTILQADSIETHHGSGLFVCGTYSLRNDSVSGRRWREGLIHLLDARGPLSSSLHSVSCGGVLDLKWSGQLLASVESEAGFALFRLSEDDDSGGKKKEMMLLETQRGKLDRKSQCLMQTAPESLINLSVDWQSPHRLAISHDDGSLSLWNVGNSEIQNVAWWDAHDNEAWIVAAHKQNVDVFWSGADDGLLRGWDSRAGFAKRKHTFQVKSEAGVTSIMPSVHDPHTWAVGGYDEELRLFDDRNTVAPLSRLPQLGGGVWRIKLRRMACLFFCCFLRIWFFFLFLIFFVQVAS